MNPRLALSMSALALLGVFWHLTPSPAGSSGEKPATDGGQTKSDGSKEEKPPPLQGLWVATCRFFGQDPGADAAKTFCDQHKFGVTRMVATIPDPSKTRLGLWADNSIASIQKGAQDAGWNFDSQWYFQSPQAIRWFLTLLFIAIVTPLLHCMAQMHRDAVLSRMSDTTVGELNKDFYVKAASYIGLPLGGIFPVSSRCFRGSSFPGCSLRWMF